MIRTCSVWVSAGKGVQAFKKGLREPPEIDVTPDDADPAKVTKKS
jgi:hypothetical protein